METNPKKKSFTPEVLDKTVIAIPLLEILKKEAKKKKRVKFADEELIPSGAAASSRTTRISATTKWRSRC
jgi:hypothetical protein